MNTRIQKMLCLALTIILTTTWSQAKGPKISEPSKVDKDYAIQGEYSGMLEADGDKAKLGVQVIAQGQGKFQAVVYEGGLPGDGWDQEKDLERINATLENGQVVFKAKEGIGVVKAGKMHIMDLDNQPVGVLKRVVRTSSTLGKKPPKGATVLFDGSNLNGWKKGRMTA
ncbi:MAG: hypothetical protein GY888_02030 [Planctomycetaceae bacterium]|nr:hypothetical protein [Planctomycetaceae bacterium]